MKRLILGGVFFEVTLLIIGLTWIGKQAEGAREEGVEVALAGDDYRINGGGTGRVVDVELDAVETVQEIAEGVDYHVWTFNGTVPGPVIRVRVGDTVRFTLRNNSTLGLSHSIDFHAAQTPWDVNYQPVAPGETLSFDWVARFPGVFMYHCGVPPVLHHIANGMYGAIVVEPQEPLPLAREFVLVSSELYPATKPIEGVLEGDLDRMTGADPEYVVFDGRANRYLDAALQAEPNELIRLWVLNAGPTLTNAFHVIGALFDHVYADGNPTSPLNGLQTWNVAPGAGAMFELRIPDEGLYPFVTHSFAYTGRGAVGVIQITPDAPSAPQSYPRMADPFTAGVEPSAYEPGAGGPVEPPTDEGEEPRTDEPGDVILTLANVAYDRTELSFPSGTSLTLVNEDSMAHDFTIDELDLRVPLGPNETTTVTVEGEPGEYAFYCSIPGHREAGMEGHLEIVGAAH